MTDAEHLIAQTLEECKSGARTLDLAFEIVMVLRQNGYKLVQNPDAMAEQAYKAGWSRGFDDGYREMPKIEKWITDL